MWHSPPGSLAWPHGSCFIKTMQGYINTLIQIHKSWIFNKLLEVGGVGSSEPDPVSFNRMWVQMNPIPFTPTQASLEMQVLWHTFTGHHHPGRQREPRSHQNVPRVWKHQLEAPEACLHQGPSCGVGSGPYSLLLYGCAVLVSLSLGAFQKAFLQKNSRWARVCGFIHLHTFIFLHHHVRIMLPKALIAIKMLLMLQPSNHGGDGHGWESPPTEECLSCSSSSSCTRSSHDSGGDWATSITSLEAICGDSALFDISLHGGRGGVGSFWPQELDESCGDPPHRVWDRTHFLLQLQGSLTFCLCWGLLYARLAFGVMGFLSHPRALLGPQEGLRWPPEVSTCPRSSSRQCHLASYCEQLSIVLKKGCKPAQCGPTCHSLGFWLHDSDASLCPQCVTGPGSGELYCQRVGQPHPRRPSLLVLCGPCTFHHCSRIHTAMHGRTVGPHTLGCPALCGCRDWPYG